MGGKYLLIALLALAVIVSASVYFLYYPQQTSLTTSTTFTEAGPIHVQTPETVIIRLGIEDEAITFREVISYSSLSSKEECLQALPQIKSDLLNDLEKKYLSGVNHSGVVIECLGNGSIQATFKVYGKMWLRGNQVYADFLWFLTPNHLDFIDNHFTELNNGLKWTGILEDIPTDIWVSLPPQKTPYSAWQQPIGHCHGHVWWITENNEG